jgi:hypothetical protein
MLRIIRVSMLNVLLLAGIAAGVHSGQEKVLVFKPQVLYSSRLLYGTDASTRYYYLIGITEDNTRAALFLGYTQGEDPKTGKFHMGGPVGYTFETTRCTTPADLVEYARTSWYSVNVLLPPQTLTGYFSSPGMKAFAGEMANLREEGVAAVYTLLGGETFSSYGIASEQKLTVVE